MKNRHFDLSTLERPSLEVTLLDENHTTLLVGVPNEKLIRKLMAYAPKLEAIAYSHNGDVIGELYELAAQLISCNRTFTEVTADELINVYNVDLEALILFYGAYIDFIAELTQRKN